MARKPTPVQRATLSEYGIVVPPTWNRARDLIRFIEMEDGPWGKDARIGALKGNQQFWLRRKVHRRDKPGLQGRVVYIIPHNPAKRATLEKAPQEVRLEQGQFRAFVEWNEGNPSFVPLRKLVPTLRSNL